LVPHLLPARLPFGALALLLLPSFFLALALAFRSPPPVAMLAHREGQQIVGQLDPLRSLAFFDAKQAKLHEETELILRRATGNRVLFRVTVAEPFLRFEVDLDEAPRCVRQTLYARGVVVRDDALARAVWECAVKVRFALARPLLVEASADEAEQGGLDLATRWNLLRSQLCPFRLRRCDERDEASCNRLVHEVRGRFVNG
jgi:hypothetical protein